jgi:hypothetical protein
MAKANKHNRRAKKLKQRKATTGSKFSKSINVMSGFGMSMTQKFHQAASAGADSIIDLDNPFGPQMWFKEGNQWVKQVINF